MLHQPLVHFAVHACDLSIAMAVMCTFLTKLQLSLQCNLVDEIGNIDTCPEQRVLEVTAGLSNSFGFGGHNSVVIFGPYKE